MEVRKSRHPPMIGFDVSLGDLFAEPESIQEASVPQVAERRLSYADAVGYEKMEVRKSRHHPMIGFDVSIGDLDLFAEPEINQQVPAP